MKRKVSDDILRQIVIARVTKGWAFTTNGQELYNRTKIEISAMTRSEIFAKYNYVTYDLCQ